MAPHVEPRAVHAAAIATPLPSHYQEQWHAAAIATPLPGAAIATPLPGAAIATPLLHRRLNELDNIIRITRSLQLSLK